MKFTPTLLAIAVAGTVAAPVAVQAGADEIYASARVGIWNVKQGTKTTLALTDAVLEDTGDITTDNTDVTTDKMQDTQIRSFASRFGARGETDLGNGLTGFGRYEWGIDFNGGGSISNRHRYVGLKGGWGSVLLGQTYHTWYNYMTGPLDNPWWHSGYTMINYRGRTDKGLTYNGGSGNFNFGATVYFDNDDEEEFANGYEIGISFGAGDSTIGLAVQGVPDDFEQGAQETDEMIYGIAWSGIGIGSTTLGLSYTGQDKDKGFVLDWGFGNAYFHYEYVDFDAADSTPWTATLGYTQSLGRKTTAYYEIAQTDADTGNSDDDRTAIMAVLKYDII
jgi:predicted porin